jgi:DNA polymerase II small subunit/DNA polymerase delta subunit B
MEGNPYRIKPPTMLDVEGVRVMIVDGKKINPAQITDYLRRRHLLPTECLPGDPYLLDTIPDIIFFFDGGKFYLENNRGITAISPDNKKGVLVDLKTRDARGVAL